MRWPTAQIGEIAQQIRGVSYSKEEARATPAPGFKPIFRANNITDNGLLFDDLVFVPEQRINDKQYVRAGDIVVAASSGSLEVVGKASQAKEGFDGAFGAFCKLVRPSNRVDARFVGHFFKTQDYRRKISALAAGANINNLRNEHIDEMLIPLPPLEEQRRIAAILDQAEALRAKRRQALAKLDTLTQSLFLDMFGDSFNPKFSIANIGDAVDSSPNSIRTGPFGSQLLHSEFVESGIPVLGIDNVVTNRFSWAAPRFISEAKYDSLRRYTVRPGDVLITIMGTCGRAAVVPTNISTAINTKHLCCITVDNKKYVPEFIQSCVLMYPASKRHLHQTSKGAIMSGLNMELIKSTPIPKPSLELQFLYRDRKAKIEEMRASYNEAAGTLDSSFASLQHRAFRGEL